MNETIPLPEPGPEPIEFPWETPHRSAPARGLSMRLRAAVALALCVCVVLCRIFAPAGAAQLRRWIVGDGSERLQQAVFRMEWALGEGEELAEVWSAFCGGLKDAPA